MPVTPTHRAERRRRRRARPGAPFTARFAAVLLAVGAFLAPVAATAAETSPPSPTPTPSPSATGIVELTLSPVGNGIVRAGDPLAVSVTRDNGTLAELDALPVSLALGAAPLGDRADLAAWLSGDVSGVDTATIGATELPALAAGETQTTGIVLAAEDPVLAGRAPGVYPLLASAETAEGPLLSTSAMIVPDPAASSTPLGVVLPITAGPLETGLLSATELAELTAPDGALTSALDAADGSAAILAIDPAIPAAIRVLGASAPASASLWLTRLLALPNTRFALQFGDADLTAQLESGLTQPAAPPSLLYAMKPKDFPPAALQEATAAPTPAPTPSGTTDPTAPSYPTLAELLDIGEGRAAVYWPPDGTASPAVVAALGALPVDDVASVTLIPSTSTTAGASGATVTARAAAQDSSLLVYDSAISDALRTAAAIDDSAHRGAALAAATAHLAFATKDAGGASLLVSLGRDADRSRVALGATLLAASEAPGTTPIGLGALTLLAPNATGVVETTPEALRSAAAASLFADQARLARFATVLDDPRLLTSPDRTAVLQLLGTAWIAEPDAWASAVVTHRAATETTLASVGLLPVPDIQQIGPSADIPVWVRNDLPFDVNVVLNAAPDDLRLDIEESIPVTARAASNTRVLIPVNAQISSGEVDVSLQLRSPTLEPVGGSQTIVVTVRADWERFGLIALGVIVGGLLVVGVIRTVLRRRASRRDTPDADAAEDTDAAPAPDPGGDGATDTPASEPAPASADTPRTPNPEDRS